MLDAMDGLLFEQRINRAAARAADNHCAYHNGDDYNVMKHDETEARRRYRAFANGVLAATISAALEEARRGLDEAEANERREYEHALLELRVALGRLSTGDQEILALTCRDRMTLKAAAGALGIPYGTARARYARALRLLSRAPCGARHHARPSPARDRWRRLRDARPPASERHGRRETGGRLGRAEVTCPREPCR
jgi:hypothetical protein